ncbi:MAG TPA: polyribonucleotide nucleotidyltransferase [Phycisphaerae bacterium]|nr:polyribonucleotide nucleotidyltransferase [Phycisphaerae bacterium]HUT59948.1 polyribonucleotide nucleotidyltransferase [Phycisphaerae bacterium]
MDAVRVEKQIGGRNLSLETGKVARQSHGAVVVRYGDTVVLATVLSAPSTRDLDFFPLFVDYREMHYAVGKVPGGFFKREGRPSSKEILTCRMIDRPIRPLFPDDFVNEVQIQCIVLSSDNENDPDMLAMIGASCALTISHTPFQGPIGAARIGHIDGNFVVNPTHAELEHSSMDLVLTAHADAVNMIELGGREVSEDVVAEGVAKGFEVCQEVIGMIEELAAGVKVEKTYTPAPPPEELVQRVAALCAEPIRQAKQIAGKVERSAALDKIREDLLAELCPEGAAPPLHDPKQVKAILYKLEGKIQRELILQGKRPDGRAVDEVRPLGIEVGVLPRTHGSALFSRGETQSLVTTTLGTIRDKQIIDGLQDEYSKKFILHYNFPPFSVGEIRPIRGPGRRDIGHGALAEKSLEGVLPGEDGFPYTIRVVSDILESNGSTSMATVCGGTLALMDAGVPIKGPVAGVSIGMVSDGQQHVMLTDILGEEDFHGDMDFKVAGTRNGITGIQLDLKARGISQQHVVEALQQARKARLFILDEMAKVIAAPREGLSPYAPRMLTVKINPEKIGKVIGPGGKTINRIQDETGATIDIEDDGTVYIACVDSKGAEAAKAAVEALTEDVEVGKIYGGKVVSVRDFGAFIEILPGQDGMCHVSELDVNYVKNVTDVVKVGDVVRVKVINIDDQGRVKLSRKAAMREEQKK